MQYRISLIRITSALIGFLVVTAGCNKYLETAPNKGAGVVPTTIADLDNLLNDQTTTSGSASGIPLELSEAYRATDDFQLSPELWDLFAGRGGSTSMTTTTALWGVADRTASGTLALNDPGYTQEFRKIFIANMILSNLSRVSGSEEAKAQLSSEAHFLRAYSYWVLVNTYCLPYSDENLNEPGLPLKLSTSYEESLARVPLSRIYEQIDSDLIESLKTTLEPMNGNSLKNWRANKAAVHCFAARYFLHRENYERALEEANASLNSYNTLLDYNVDIMETTPPVSFVINRNSTDADYPQQTINIIISNLSGWVGAQHKEVLYYRSTVQANGWTPMSTNLISQYDQANDLRWKYCVVPGALNATFGLIAYPTLAWPSWSSFGTLLPTYLNSGPSVSEAILVKAECEARLNDASAAMATVNTLRAKRIRTSAGASVINLTAASPQEAVTKILQERRREMPFTMRWYDLRRLNNNSDPNDDVVVIKEMYDFDALGVKVPKTVRTFTLEAKSRRYAMPIPYSEIVAGNGIITQNTY
ncbi:MAG: RagB/SusD family nutrient uptake outer membrane protein [Chitinophagaceae bacterium]